jgi:hypothetical protein
MISPWFLICEQLDEVDSDHVKVDLSNGDHRDHLFRAVNESAGAVILHKKVD